MGDVEFVFHSSFIEPRCTARSLEGKTVVMAQPCYGDYSQRRQGPDKCPQGPIDPVDPEHPCSKPMRPPWFIENVFTNLTAEAGQWYYHRANGTILYMPRHGETLDSVNQDAFTTIEETLLVVNWAPHFGGRIDFPPPEKNELVLSIETGVCRYRAFSTRTKHPVLTRSISYLWNPFSTPKLWSPAPDTGCTGACSTRRV